MSKKRDRGADDISKARVKLKPLFGMQPGVYLTILYAFVLALIVFLVLFLPGITGNGSVVSVRSTPEGAAVWVDARYVGATPLRVFVRSGPHEIDVVKPDFEPVKKQVTIGGRLFASLIVPRRASLVESLTVKDLPALLATAFDAQSRWALIDTILPNYQLPPILADAVRGAARSVGFTDRSTLERFVIGSAPNVRNEFMLRDFLAAAGYAYSTKGALLPSGALQMAADFANLIRKYPNTVFWMYDALPRTEQARIASAPWFKSYVAAYQSATGAFHETSGASTAPGALLEGIRFVPVPGGSYLKGASVGAEPADPTTSSYQLPHPVSVPSFSMSETEVSYADFARFLDANPTWRPANRDALVREGLATSDYLKDWDAHKDSSLPVAYVSYFAAHAYCDWLSSLLSASFAGWKVRLPTSTEWEWAARMGVDPRTSMFHESADAAQPVGSGAPNRLGIRDLLGNVWEWCENWYYPAAYTLSAWGTVPAFAASSFGQGAEKSVRGGSYASSRDGVNYTTRASQPPAWCTPFLGFRPVLAKG